MSQNISVIAFLTDSLIGCLCFREQRLTGFVTHVLIGLSVLLTPVLKVGRKCSIQCMLAVHSYTQVLTLSKYQSLN